MFGPRPSGKRVFLIAFTAVMSGLVLGPFLALLLQAVAIAIISMYLFRQAMYHDVARWRESRFSIAASLGSCAITLGLLFVVLYSLTRTLYPRISSFALPLLLFFLLSGPFYPLWRRRLPLSTVASSTLWGAVLFVVFYALLPAQQSPWVLSIGLYLVLLMWVVCGYMHGLLLIAAGVRNRSIGGRDRVFQEFITLWCVLLLHGMVIFRYLVWPYLASGP